MDEAFDDMADLNPFANPASSTAPKKTTYSEPKVETTDMPMNYSSGFDSGAPFSSRYDAPFSSNILTNEQLEFQRREEELRRREAELARKEAELAKSSHSGYKPPNFPPFPPWTRIQPCFYININEEIPIDHQPLCKQIYYNWIGYSIMLFINIFAMMMLMVSGAPGSTVAFIVSLLIFVVIVPLSFICVFRNAYVALKTGSSFSFVSFFFSCGIETFMHFIQLLGITGNAWAGFINGGYLIDNKNKFGGAICILMGFCYSALFIHCIYIIRKMHFIYKSSGATFQQAQSEFTAGVWRHGGSEIIASGFAPRAANVP